MHYILSARRAVATVVCAIACIVVCVPSMAQGPSHIVISQVYGGGGNSGATLRNDFVELFNPTDTAVSVAGWSIQYASSGGTSWQVTPLSGSIQPHAYFLVQEAKGSGGTNDLPVPDAIGAIPMSATAGKIALVNVATALSGSGCPFSANVVDFVGFGSANCSEGGSSTPALSNTLAALRGGDGCVDTDNNAADFSTGTPSPKNSAASAHDCVVVPVTPQYAIHDIQGSGNTSPYAGETVQTTGVVTARIYNGFFIQSLEPDSDATTSEGLFVFTSTNPPAQAQVGSLVTVKGTVQEYAPAGDLLSPTATELAAPAIISAITGYTLPAPIEIASAELNSSGPIDQLERYEGMRVRVAEVTVVGATGGNVSEKNATSTSNGVFFGVIPGTSRPFRENGIELPATAPGIAEFDGNPERIRIDSDAQTGATPIDVNVGASVTELVGVLDFGSRTYTVDLDPGVAHVISNNDLKATPVRPAAADEITVASFNMERFFDTVDDAGISDVALTPDAFALRLNKASMAIRNVLRTPDILGVEEVENLGALQAIADRINGDAVAAGDPNPKYQAYLFEGNDIGGIDVGFLVNSGRIAVASIDQEGKDATFNTDQRVLNDRPPVVLKAQIVPQGKDLPFAMTVIVNHLRSLSDVDVDPIVRTKRLLQAEFLAKLIDDHQKSGELVVSVGDYNAYEVNDGYVDVMNTVRGGTPHPAEDVLGETEQLVATPLIDLAPADPLQHYSYSFGGTAQVLDHIVVSQGLRVNEFTYARMNADFADVLRSDPTRPERLSDHDAPIAYFAVPQDSDPPVVSITGVSDGAMYLLGLVPAIGCNTTDALSGVASEATLSIAGGAADGVGQYTATCSGAIDKVGNAAEPVSVHYTVTYAFAGFSSPLAGGATYKAGSTVPVKFQLHDGMGNLITSADAVSAVVTGPCGGALDRAPSAGGSVLRYDDIAQQFVFNWKTSGTACMNIGVELEDTTTHTVMVTLR